MSNEIELVDELQHCFGISILNTNNINNNSIVINYDLYNTITEAIKNKFGKNNVALKMSIDPSKYRKYCDGTYSSMINNSISKIKHNGFEGVNLIDLAKEIYDGINKNLAQSILQKYNQHLLDIFNSVNNIQHEINDIIISEHLAVIESYKFFYEDLQEDIDEIILTHARRMAYLNSIVSYKTKIYENFIFLIGRLKNITNKTNSCLQYSPTIDELKTILLKTSFLIRLYLNNSIYEYVLSGNFTKSSKDKIKRRCKEMEKMLIDTLESLKIKYNSIYSDFNCFITGCCSNGFFVKNSLNNFNNDSLLLDYSELDNLDSYIKNNLENIKILSVPNTQFFIEEPIDCNYKEARKKVLQKHTTEVEKYQKENNQDFSELI